MKKIMLAALGITSALGAVSAADARQGCGAGYHRGPYGGCRINVRDRVGPGGAIIAPGGLIVGNYYGGRGYWDGRRYWANRYRWHGGWRYR